MGNEDSDEGHRPLSILSADRKCDTDNGYDSSNPMFVPRSYEELLISASKSSGEEYGRVTQVKVSMNVSDHLKESHTYPSQNDRYPYMHDASTSSNSRRESLRHGSYCINWDGHPFRPRFKHAEQSGGDIYKDNHINSGSMRDSHVGYHGTLSKPGHTTPTGVDNEATFSYETTSYATQTGTEYDSVSQSDVSFAAFERRDVENDVSLPIANIGRVMKSVLPGSAKIAKHAKDIVRDCVTEFIMFISSEASDICANERRKTLSAEDIFLAMSSLGFERYNEALRRYHARWKERDHSSMMDP